jgi:radical SAM-linked protein
MRVRLRFTKLGKIRFTSQRDTARMWERALRRAGLPLAYSSGFSPRPQLSFGLALPTACESLAEYLDVALDPERAEAAGVSVASLPQMLTGLLPEGITVEEAVLLESGKGSLQQLVTSCSWVMGICGVSFTELETQVDRLLAATSAPIIRERKGREELDDLRPSIIAMDVQEVPVSAFGVEADVAVAASLSLLAELATQPRGVRPGELLRALAVVQPEAADGQRVGVPVLDRACRTQQWIERDGIREEPIERRWDDAGAGRAARALERAS